MQGSVVWVFSLVRCRGLRCCRSPLSPASSARWLPWVGFSFLAGFNGLGVSLGEMSGNDIAMSGGGMWAVYPIYCFPLQVRAVVAMVKFSQLTNFVLNKKLGCIIQNCSLGGCHLSPASSARWLPLVGGSIPLQGSMVRACHWWAVLSLQVSMVRVCPWVGCLAL